MAINEDDLKEYSLKEFRKNLTHIVGEVMHTHQQVRVTSYGRVAGYFVSAEDMAYWEELEEREDLKAVADYLAKGPDQPTIPFEVVKRELDL